MNTGASEINYIESEFHHVHLYEGVATELKQVSSILQSV